MGGGSGVRPRSPSTRIHLEGDVEFPGALGRDRVRLWFVVGHHYLDYIAQSHLQAEAVFPVGYLERACAGGVHTEGRAKEEEDEEEEEWVRVGCVECARVL